MPRHKKPARLVDSSLTCTVRIVANAIRQVSGKPSEAIRSYVKELPTTLSDRFTKSFLESLSAYPGKFWDGTSFRDAFSPRCSRIEISCMHISEGIRYQVFHNLDALPGLTHLEVDSHWGCNPEDYVTSRLTKHLKSLPKLKVLRIGTVTDESLFFGLIQHCPNLQELTMVWELPTRPTVRWDSFKSVGVTYHGSSAQEVKFMLDNIPNLTSLNIYEPLLPELLDVLQVQDTYQLQNLEVFLQDPGILELLAQHFPRVREINAMRACDLTPLNLMENLKVLTVAESSPEMISKVVQPCFSRLTQLTLTFLINLDAALESAPPLPNLTNLCLYSCRRVSLHVVAYVFPGLTHLKFMYTYPSGTAVSKGKCEKPFRQLERLRIYDKEDRFSPSHLEYLLGHCVDLVELDLSQRHRLDDALVFRILRKNPMPRMRTLALVSDSLTLAILPSIFDCFGTDLTQVCLYGRTLEQQMRPETMEDTLETLLRPFYLQLIILDKSYGCGYDMDYGDDEE